MRHAYRHLGRWICRHRIAVVVVWVVILICAAVSARRAPGLLDAGSRQLANTTSARVAEILAHDFSNPFAQSLAITFHSDSAHFDDPDFQQVAARLLTALRACPGVARAILPDASFGTHFRSTDGHGIVLLIGLGSGSAAEAGQRVPAIRQCVASVWPRTGPLAGWEWHVTGQSAMIYDLNLFNAADSERAEMRALPLTLFVLLLVFGSLVSSLLPLALGVGSTLLVLGLVPGLVHWGPINILYQNVATLLGLALGIDYSLFLVNSYREHRETAGMDRETALAETLAGTGVAVTYSGLTVMIGFAGLLFTPLFELRSMGLGGMAVVAATLLLALTLLPALLDLCAPWLGSPRRLSRALRLTGSRQRWEIWMAFVLRRPALGLLFGLGLLLVLSVPLLSINPGFPDKLWMPQTMESSRGFATLRGMGQAQEMVPINLIVRAQNGGPVLPAQVDGFFALSEQIRRDPRVARIFGPVNLSDDLQEFQLRTLYLNLEQGLEEHPELGELLLSRGHDQALVQVILKDRTGYRDSLACADDLKALRVPGLDVQVGGHWTYCNDFDNVMLAAYPVVVGMVVVVTLGVLFIAFRSFLVPVKALLLNTLSVTAAFGATVAVFQWGWGASLLGMDEPCGSIPLSIPLIVFCVTFGLSMDYEVFILTRVREEYLRSRDTDASVRRGLVATGGLITGAAAIMVVVFGTFALTDLLLVKMMGFGLTVAVFVDAAVVRALMVPAAMKLAGRWNWLPGIS